MMFGYPDDLAGYVVAKGDRCNGVMVIKPKGLTITFSNGGGWQHVSVSRKRRMPTYEDMDWVKRAFWSAEATVMQLHVPAQEHINCHPYCLHLWRPTEAEIPRPPGWMVG